ncbi:hypothetical protein ACIHJG_39890 [Streptomyces sp. NPDC052415]|uniref:hypothetical protein n=1 Tax=Streptomyces sp. NPDC052415 TaxID=3365690 RepID=UPI0037D4428E
MRRREPSPADQGDPFRAAGGLGKRLLARETLLESVRVLAATPGAAAALAAQPHLARGWPERRQAVKLLQRQAPRLQA